MQIDTNKILDRLKTVYEIRSDAALARMLGISRTTPAGWRTRDSADLYTIFKAFPDVNLNWLVRGIGRPKLTTVVTQLAPGLEPSESIEDDLDVPILGRYRTNPTTEPVVVDILRSHGHYLRDWLEDRGRADPEQCFVIRYDSGSMFRLIKPGDLVLGERSDTPKRGLFVFWLDGNVEVRHVEERPGGYTLLSEEDSAQETEWTEDWKPVGSVVGIVQSKLFWEYEWKPPKRP